jgi:FKBP-type peptidyl-prolyl cis-trans isomerase SlyD
MQIEKNKVVSLTYTLTLDNGEVADTATLESPFVFIHGIGQTLPQFDLQLSGLKPGDAFEFDIDAENAYGISNEAYKIHVPRNVFEGPDVPADLLEVGNMVPMQDDQGNPMNGIILSIDDNSVLIDFNHPLSDQKLHFKGDIISLREATAEELAHGHVHGDGGHHH